MKRTVLFVSLLMLIGFGAFSQSLQLKFGEEIVSNDTVYMSGSITDDLLELHIKVKNLTDKEIEVKVRKVEISIVEGSVNTFCWGGSCFMPTVFTSPLSTIIAANSTDFNSFAGDYEPSGIAGSSIISYTFFNVQNEEDTVKVTAFYQVGTDGINNIGITNDQVKVYPNPIIDNVNIEFNNIGQGPCTIRLFSLEGRLLKEIITNSPAGKHSFSITDVPTGYAVLEISNSKGSPIRKRILIN